MQLIEQGELIDRTYEQKQASPGDVEAVEGMGTISDHSKENLVSGDRGVSMYRNQIRKYCRDLQNGIRPPQPSELAGAIDGGEATGIIPTHGSDTIVKLPEGSGASTNDSELLAKTNDEVMDIIFAGDALGGEDRNTQIIEQLKQL